LKGNAQNIFANKRKFETQFVPIRPARKNKKEKKTSLKKKKKRKETLEMGRRHFSACFSNLVFPYKNQETPLWREFLFLVEKHSPERDWTVAPVTLVLL
jgi:hypothetical protein